MQFINSNLRARRLAAQWAVLATGLSAAAWSGEALARTGQPLAYVTNSATNSVSVIDTGDNTVVDTIPVGTNPYGVAVAPDGKHVYVISNDVSVIDTTTDKVVATIRVGSDPFGVTVTPDGNRVYVANENFGFAPGTVSVINTATNTVAATVAVGLAPEGVAVTPDGKYAYVANGKNGILSVIATRSNTVVATVGLALNGPYWVAVAPDGKHVYVTNFNSSGPVWVIETATNTVVATVPVGPGLDGWVAVSPDGKHAYAVSSGNPGAPGVVSVIATDSNTVVATVTVGLNPQAVVVAPDGRRAYVTNSSSDTVSVIDTDINKVVATAPVAGGPSGVGIIPPPQGVQFLAFSAKLDIHAAKWGAFDLQSEFTLSSTASNGIHPDHEAIKLQVGPFITTIPAGSFRHVKDGFYTFRGVIDGVWLEAQIKPTGTLRYAFNAEAKGANLSGTTNPLQVSLGIGGDAGLTEVTAYFDRYRQAFGD